MARTRREKLNEATREEIKQTARKLMQDGGTAALSLRGIAREMGLSAPALYHYFGSLDDLITALILDAFHAIADHMEMTARTHSDLSTGERLLRVIKAYREWALEHRVDFQLLYGSPIPGYVAPAELTVAAARRGFDVFVGLMIEALMNGDAHMPDYHHIPDTVKAHLLALYGDELPEETQARESVLLALYISVTGWGQMHGIIMLELFEHLPPVIGDVDAYYDAQLRALLRSGGFKL